MGLSGRATAEPEVPEGWVSALRLSQERGEDYHSVVRRLKGLYRDALRELRQQGHTDQSAAATVQQHLVKCVRPLKGKRRIWIASEEGVRQLGERDVLNDTATTRPDLISRLSSKDDSWVTRLDSLFADGIAGGYSSSEAIRAIRRHLDERGRSSSDSGGRPQSR